MDPVLVSQRREGTYMNLLNGTMDSSGIIALHIAKKGQPRVRIVFEHPPGFKSEDSKGNLLLQRSHKILGRPLQHLIADTELITQDLQQCQPPCLFPHIMTQ